MKITHNIFSPVYSFTNPVPVYSLEAQKMVGRKVHEKAQVALDLQKHEDTVTVNTANGLTFSMPEASAALKLDMVFVVPYSHGKTVDSLFIKYLIELDAFIDNKDAMALYEQILDEENVRCIRDVLYT